MPGGAAPRFEARRMSDSAKSTRDISSAARSKPTATNTTVLRCDDHADLAGVLQRTRAVAPALWPTSLPAKVVIKPNLCDIVSWESGVTTDPSWLPALAAELRAIRPDVRIVVVESDAISAYKSFRSCEETFDRLGYTDIAREHGIELVNLSQSESIEISLTGIPVPVLVSELFLEEFYFISIANLKVHSYEYMTAILKNSIGLLTGSDIGALHPYLPALISQLHQLCPPDFCIVDGRIGLEGHGPILGDPVAMNAIIFSNDALSADVAACKLMMIPSREVPHLRQTAKDLGRSLPDVAIPEEITRQAFAFNVVGHRSITAKFANRRLHRASELFTNRWMDRLQRFKRAPLKFATEAIPKLARRLHAR
jgi:uncharacterized protein (DUF362 family)